MSVGDKIWERPWTTQQFIDSSDNWTLAGDVALLNTLKSFANDLLTKSNTTNNNLNDLTQKLDETGLKLNIVRNEFQSLRNTQFIESRVYEEDETVPVQEDDATTNANEKEEEIKIKQMKEAVNKGLEVVDKYYDKVEVNGSDSEEESEFVGYVLRRKDPYINRPLPYIIGTEEWHKKWHVGLEESSSDSEAEKVSEKYSDSDSETDLPIADRSQIKGTSDTSSELDFSHKSISSGRPVANSTFGDTRTEHFGSSDSDPNSLPVNTPIANQNFAEQLAAKLGTVIQNSNAIEPEVNKRPIQNITETNKFPGIFFDEPPPLDDQDDILENTSKKSLFSAGRNLFDGDDEEDNDTLWNQQKDTSLKPETTGVKRSTNLFDNDEVDKGLFTDSTLKDTSDSRKAPPRLSQKTTRGLFDESESSDEDIFKTLQTNSNKNSSYLKPFGKLTLPLLDDEPPALDTNKVIDGQDKTAKRVTTAAGVADKENLPENATKKKLVGGKSLFGDSHLLMNQKLGTVLKNRRPDSSDDENGSETDTNVSPKKENKSETVNNISNNRLDNSKETPKPPIVKPRTLVDRPKPTMETSKSQIEKPKIISEKSRGAAEDKKVSPKKPFAKETVTQEKVNEIEKPKKVSLFDDTDDLFKDDLFSGFSTKKFTSSLFDDDDLLKNDLFSSFSTKTTSMASNLKKTSLFDDVEDADDFLDPEKGLSGILKKTEKKTENVKKINKVEIKPNISLDEKGPKIESSGSSRGISGILEENRDEKDGDMSYLVTKTEKTNNMDVSQEFNKNVDKNDNSPAGKLNEDTVKKESPTEKIPSQQKELNTPNLFGDNLFKSEKLDSNPSDKSKPNFNLFNDPDDDNLFSVTSLPKSKISSLFTHTLNNISTLDDKLDNENIKPTIKVDIAAPSGSKNVQSTVKVDVAAPSTSVSGSKRVETVVQVDVPAPSSGVFGSKKVERPSHINLFDPTPPPDDDDWDTKSDDNDPFSDYDSLQRQNLFDEPTSLLYESSGIGSHVTRIETDDSSFYPDAASSRRFSTDIYSDEQSADLFFITKNKTEPTNLNSIPETSHLNVPSNKITSTMSAVDITPSGDSKDLYQEATSGTSKSIPESSEKTEKFDPHEYDVSKSTGISTSSQKITSDEVELTKEELKQASVENKYLSSLPPLDKDRKNKIELITDQLRSGNSTESTEIKPAGSPGKLKHNLNINVNALMPGAAPPRRKELTKSKSMEPSVDVQDFVSLPSSENYFSSDDKHSSLERSSSFENSNVEVLQHVTKDRARIPIKRRPSTKRGRQHIKKVVSVEIVDPVNPEQSTDSEQNLKIAEPSISDIDLQKDNIQSEVSKDIKTDIDSSFMNSREQEVKETISVGENKPLRQESPIVKSEELLPRGLFADGDDDNLFTNQPDLKVNVKVEQKDIDSLFDQPEPEDDLFGEKIGEISIIGKMGVRIPAEDLASDYTTKTEVTSHSNESEAKNKEESKASNVVPKPTSLFDGDDEEDDILFGSKKLVPKLDVSKKSLFDDDDEDDIFGTSKSSSFNSTQKTGGKKATVNIRPQIKVANVRRLENTETDDDPLSALLK